MNAACASLAELPADADAVALARSGVAARGRALAELVAAGAAFAASRDASARAASPKPPGRRTSPRRAATSRPMARPGCAGPARPSAAPAPPGAASRPRRRRPTCKAQLALLDRLIAAQASARRSPPTTRSARRRSARLWAGERSRLAQARRGAGVAARPRATRRCCPSLVRLLAEVGDRAPPIMLAEQAAACSRRSAPTGRALRRAAAARPRRGLRRAAQRRARRSIGSRGASRAGPSSRRRCASGSAMARRSGRRSGSACRASPSSSTRAACPPNAPSTRSTRPTTRRSCGRRSRPLPALAAFAGPEQERLIERFQELDRERIQIARREVAARPSPPAAAARRRDRPARPARARVREEAAPSADPPAARARRPADPGDQAGADDEPALGRRVPGAGRGALRSAW